MGSRAAGLRAVIAGAILLAAIPSSAKPKDDPSRTITVQLAVDRSIPNLTEWRFAANSFLEGAVRTFHTHFGIKIAFKGPVRWQPEVGKRTLEEALGDLSVKVPPGGCDIVLGIIDPARVSSRTLGIASYINSCVLIGNVPDPGVMRYAVLHEMCHIFGAIDLGEKGSLMSMRGSNLSFDKFTTDAVALHKDRTFSRGAFPLPRANVEAAIKLYADRSSRRLGEPETQMFLTLFYLEKEDLDAASRASEEAAREDPNMMGLEVLLGNIRLGHGQPDLAIAHYEKAMKHEPADAGLHYNLGLAYAALGRFTEAAEQCRESLRLNPGLVVARLGLARLYLAAGSAEAAAAECRKALESDPRSAEALCLLGTAMVALERPFEPTPEVEKAPGLDVPNSVAPGSPEAELAAADAVKYLKMSIAIDPANPQAYISLGQALAAQHKYAEAEKSYLEALNLEPEDLDAHYGLGSMYLEMGNVHKAIFHLEQIMTIDPASDLGSRMVTGAFRIARAYPLFRRKAER